MSSQTSTSPGSPQNDSIVNPSNDVESAGTAPESPQTRPSYPQTSPSRSSSSSIPSLSGSPSAFHSSEPFRSIDSNHLTAQQDDSHESTSRTAIGMNRRDAFFSVPGTYNRALDSREQEEEGSNRLTVSVGDEVHQSVHSHHGSSPEQHNTAAGPSSDATLHDQISDDASSTHDVSSQTGLSYDRSSQNSPLQSESLHQRLSDEGMAHYVSHSIDTADELENSNANTQPEVFGGATPYQEENSSPICSPLWYRPSMPPFSSLVPTPTKQDTGTSPGRPTNPLHRSLHIPDGFDHWSQEIRDAIQAQGEGLREVLAGIEVRIDALKSEITDRLREEVRDQSESLRHELCAEIGEFRALANTLLSEFGNPASSILSELRELGPQMGRAEERVGLQMSELRDDMRRLALDMREMREMENTETIDADSDSDMLASQVDELRDRVNVLEREMSTISHRQNEFRTTVRLQTTRSEVAGAATQASLDLLIEAMEMMKIECRDRHAIAQEGALQEPASQYSNLEKNESHGCDMPKSHHECLAKLAGRGYINSLKDDLKTSLECSTDALIHALRTDLQEMRIDLDNSHKTFLTQIAGCLGRDAVSMARANDVSATQSTAAAEKHDDEAQENIKASVKVSKRVRFEDVVPGGEPRKRLNGEGVLNVLSFPSALAVRLPVLYFVTFIVVLGVSWLLARYH
ncbi:hypothetical protein BDV97DRAFT_394708 [Delphinella strobiligena]|nr:hypothetical protein BDV97DRAFT_394708 [Delphinella strobiligena]